MIENVSTPESQLCDAREQEFREDPSPGTAYRLVDAFDARRRRFHLIILMFAITFVGVLLMLVAIAYFADALDPFFGALAAIIGVGVVAYFTGRLQGASGAFRETSWAFEWIARQQD